MAGTSSHYAAEPTLAELEAAIGSGAEPNELSERFGDSWIHIYAQIRKLFPNISTRPSTAFHSGLICWLVDNYRPSGEPPSLEILRKLSIAEAAGILLEPRKKKKKRSTEPNEAQLKLVAALTKHHKYENGSCLNWAAIGNNELARLADVAESTASDFFKAQFGDHGKYKVSCRHQSNLVAKLMSLNGETIPPELFNQHSGRQTRADSDNGDNRE